MAKGLSKQELRRTPVKKRTSIGTNGVPKNKSKRRSFKPYRGQG